MKMEAGSGGAIKATFTTSEQVVSKEFHAVAQCLSWFASFTDPHSKVMNSVSWLGQLKVCKSIDIFDI
jgi:hypothetical protein